MTQSASDFPKKKCSQIATICTVVSLGWFVHPLNMEVLGWLSAGSYTYSLFFSVLSMISMEYSIGRSRRLKQGFITFLYSATSLLCMILAVLCKGPAIAVPAAQLLYLMQEYICSTDSKQQKDALKIFCLNHAFYLFLAITLVTPVVIGGNNTSATQYPEFISLAGYIVGAVLRASLTIMRFLGRSFLFPSEELTVIYAVPSAFKVLYLLPELLAYLVWRTPPSHPSVQTMQTELEIAEIAAIRVKTVLSLLDHPDVSGALVSSICSFLALVSFTLLLLGLHLQQRQECQHADKERENENDIGNFKYREGSTAIFVFPWIAYLALWLPCCGLLQHGIDQLGANRYCYFTSAFGLLPLIAEATLFYFRENNEINTLKMKQIKHKSKRISIKSWRGVEEDIASASAGASAAYRYWIPSISIFIFIGRLCMWSSIGLCTFSLIIRSHRELHVWSLDGGSGEPDRVLLERCVRVDPMNSHCHRYLAESLGTEGRRKEMEFEQKKEKKKEKEGKDQINDEQEMKEMTFEIQKLLERAQTHRNRVHQILTEEELLPLQTQGELLYQAYLLVMDGQTDAACGVIDRAYKKGYVLSRASVALVRQTWLSSPAQGGDIQTFTCFIPLCVALRSHVRPSRTSLFLYTSHHTSGHLTGTSNWAPPLRTSIRTSCLRTTASCVSPAV